VVGRVPSLRHSTDSLQDQEHDDGPMTGAKHCPGPVTMFTLDTANRPMPTTADSPLQILSFPYHQLQSVVEGPTPLRDIARVPGSALVWQLEAGVQKRHVRLVGERPGGMALLIVLPRAPNLATDPTIWQLVAESRPHAILPYHDRPVESDLAQILRKPPENMSVAVTDYLKWRGIRIDSDTVHLLRRTLELSADLNSVTALSRSLYLSRRALGRRFESRGLPVPSHWLQFGRLVRFALRLQNSDESIYSIACSLGYADGFAASNQMHRLFGFRPTEVREYLGWEWILEAWLRREADAGTFRPNVPEQPAAQPPRSGSGSPDKISLTQRTRGRRRAAG